MARYHELLLPAGGVLKLFLNLAEIERARGLARRIVFHRNEELRRQLLDRNEHEHALEEPVIVGVGIVLRLLERITPQIEEQRHPEFDERLTPHAKLLPAVL